jgi:hypothetical protein
LTSAANTKNMGLKNFLKQRGFIADEPGDTIKEHGNTAAETQQNTEIPPTFFPLQPVADISAGISTPENTGDPSFVAPLQQSAGGKEQLDPTFVKFFEDELVKANVPGPDYFEFRQLLMKTQQKMASKGVAAPEVVLQAVLMSFEAQNVTPANLIDAARHYKDVLRQKNDDFLKGAEAEKNNQLQKRQNVLQAHNDNIKKLQQQLEQLELQKQQLVQSIGKEQTQLEVNKTMGKEGIEKIERAERLIALAHNYIQSTIDTDIKRLQ